MHKRFRSKIPPQAIKSAVRAALDEDLGQGDITTALVPREALVTATLIAREQAVLCGCDWFNEVFHCLDPGITVEWFSDDARVIDADQILCKLQGPIRPLLSGERTAINFLQTLSGTATTVAEYAKIIAGTQARLLDTRKTIPGLRLAQKYAVICGGGDHQRIGLYDGFLIKENHILAQRGLSNAVAAAKKQGPPVHVEVETLEELEQALSAGADGILLDNFSVDQLKQAVAINRGRAKLEASGNIDKDNLTTIVATGVDSVSIGSLTKHMHAIDFSMRIDTAEHRS